MNGTFAPRANMLVGAAIAVAVILAVVLLALPRIAAPAGELRAIVHDGDGATHELPLSQDGEITVATSLGTNVIVVEGGAVYVRDADCPNHDCIRQGRISEPGGQIVCLPHQLWIEVVADGEDGAGELDVTTR